MSAILTCQQVSSTLTRWPDSIVIPCLPPSGGEWRHEWAETPEESFHIAFRICFIKVTTMEWPLLIDLKKIGCVVVNCCHLPVFLSVNWHYLIYHTIKPSFSAICPKGCRIPNSYCAKPGVCQCKPGFVGKKCIRRSLMCKKKCLNGGRCFGGKCKCPKSHWGDNCQHCK